MSAAQPPTEHDSTPDDLAARLEQLLHERETLHAALPAHSIPPAMVMRLDDLDDEIAALRARIAAQGDDPATKP